MKITVKTFAARGHSPFGKPPPRFSSVAMKAYLLRLVVIFVAWVATLQWPAQQSVAIPAFQNPDLPVGQRVDDLIPRLTVQEKIGQTMMASPEIKRLGIPRYDWWNEGLHGVARNGTATVFPQAIGLAATWNPGLHQRIAGVISTEARAKNNEAIRNSGVGAYQAVMKAPPSGRPTSISSATRAGAAARRLTVRIRS